MMRAEGFGAVKGAFYYPQSDPGDTLNARSVGWLARPGKDRSWNAGHAGGADAGEGGRNLGGEPCSLA